MPQPSELVSSSIEEQTHFTDHAAQRITIIIATIEAKLAMITTKRKISLCSVVSPVDDIEDSFAILPLRHNSCLSDGNT